MLLVNGENRQMKITAIICEYNPLTNGHAEHLKRARLETGADTILCVMSGSFTQRGDAAIADKYMRAEQAIYAGADIVVELPTIYAISPADNFAYGAIKTISAFPDVNYLSFGSECGDANKIKMVAELLANEPEELSNSIRTHLDNGVAFPKARAMAIKEYAEIHTEYQDCANLLDSPNNILGIAYAVAIIKAGLDIKLHTIKREGGDFDSTDISTPLPSSSAVRSAFAKGDFESIKNAVPESVVGMLSIIKPQRDALGDMTLFKLKSISGYELEKYYDVSGGIHNRLKIAATSAITIDELLENAKTKAYTMARLKRICLYALFDITKKDYEECVKCPPYVQILALKKERKDVLSLLSMGCKNVLTRYSDINKVDKSLRYMVKLDFTAQGTLDIINRNNIYNKKMLLI